MCYAARYMPFYEPEDNYLELINEATVLIVTTILLAYPDGMLRPDHAANWGYVMIAIILLDVLLNMLLFLLETIKLIWNKAIRPFYY